MYMYMYTCMQSIYNQMVESTFKGPQFKAEDGLGLFFVLKKNNHSSQTSIFQP